MTPRKWLEALQRCYDNAHYPGENKEQDILFGLIKLMDTIHLSS